MVIEIVSCPRCGKRAYFNRGENRLECMACGCVICNYR